MPVARVYGSLVLDAIRFYEELEIWFGVGKNTAWPNEGTPEFQVPAVDLTATTITEPQFYKKADTVYLVKPVAAAGDGIIKWGNGYYQIVDKANALAEDAYFVYYSATIDEGEAPTTTYRQVGTFTRLVRADGVDPALSLLTPEQVASAHLEVLENRTVVTHDANTTEQLHYVREF